MRNYRSSCFSRSLVRSYRSLLCVLLLQTITPGCESQFTTVKVKLYESAVLPCSGRCSGLASWTVSHLRSDILAECNQTACRSVKEGYQMNYNQYLQGNLSLIISRADYSKRNWYTCECNRRDFCDVRLQIEAITSNVEIQPGESLLLEMKISDPVEVIYNSTGSAAGSRDQICTVDDESLQCKPEYNERTSLTSAVELRDMKPSASGVYTVSDIRNKEDILIYTVTVTDVQQSRIWKEGYKNGYGAGREDGYAAGYQKGLGVGGGSFGIIALAVGVILGVFVVPRVLRLIRTREQTKQPDDNGAADALSLDRPT